MRARSSELERWARAGLVADIDDKIALWAAEEGELSDLLATAGVLPMFGFPTRARNLYGQQGLAPGAHWKTPWSPTGRSTWRCRPSPRERRSCATGCCTPPWGSRTTRSRARPRIRWTRSVPRFRLGPAASARRPSSGRRPNSARCAEARCTCSTSTSRAGSAPHTSHGTTTTPPIPRVTPASQRCPRWTPRGTVPRSRRSRWRSTSRRR